MAGKRPAVSPEDQALFLAAVGGATPLHGRDRVPVPSPSSPPSPVRVDGLCATPRVAARPGGAGAFEPPPTVKLTVEGDGRSYTARAPGVSRAQAAELRAGKVRVEETLDLHGLTVEAGLARLREFVAGAAGRRRCVLIVHGRGQHSEHGAPLREAVLAELLGPLSGLVHALATASPADGGEGATYLSLRGAP